MTEPDKIHFNKKGIVKHTFCQADMGNSRLKKTFTVIQYTQKEIHQESS